MRRGPAARSPASISAVRCARRSKRASPSRAGGMRWRRASRSRPSGSATGGAFSGGGPGQAVTKARAEAGLRVDAALTANAATPELVHRLEAAGPFGAGAPEPLFALPRHRLAEVTAVGVEGRHLRLRAVGGDGRAVEGIAFRASGKKLGEALTRLKGAPVHLAG